MTLRGQRIAAWCGPAFVILFAVGFWAFADFVPPPSPDDSAAEIAQRYEEDRDGIRVGIQLAITGAGLFLPFVAVLSLQLRRIEGPRSPWAFTQLAGGIASVAVFIFPLMNLQTAAFRGDRSDDEAVRILNDLGWLPFVGLFPPPTVQVIAIALVIFADRSPDPVFPRWVGYFNIWIGLLFLPGSMIVFYKDGPLAWDGVFCWWIPAAAFFGWIVVMFPMLLRAIASEERAMAEQPQPTAAQQPQ